MARTKVLDRPEASSAPSGTPEPPVQAPPQHAPQPPPVARVAARAPMGHNGGPHMTVPGRVVVTNRAGQPVSRTSAVSGVDQFYIPPGVIPPGWSWEWKNESVLGQPDPQYAAELYQVGWEPVMAESYPGVFMPLCDPSGNPYKGPVRRKGMMLMERRMELTLEARRDETKRANQAVGNAKRKHGAKMDTAGTYAVDVEDRRIAPVVRSSVEAIDAPAPSYEYGTANGRIPIE